MNRRWFALLVCACTCAGAVYAQSTPVPGGGGGVDASALVRSATTCSLVADDADTQGQMRPFQRPGWSRGGAADAGVGRTFDEMRTWPAPLIAPPEGWNGWPSFEQETPVFCFSAKTPVSRAMQDQLSSMLRGPLQPRYNVVTPWASRTVYWSFVPDGVFIPDAGTGDLYSGNSSLFARMDSLFGGDRALWISLVQSCFDRWANLTGLTFVRVRFNGQEWDDGAAWNNLYAPGLRGDIRIGLRNIDDAGSILAYAYFPSVDTALNVSGNMVLDTSENWADATSAYRMMRNTIMHELGHAIGIDHVCPINSTKLMEPYLSTAFWGPQHDDMRAAHALYGDAYEPNNTAATARNEGSIAPGVTDIVGTIGGTTVPNSSLVSIVGSDADWYEYTLTVPAPLSISASPVGTSYLDGPQVVDDCSGTQGTTSSVNLRALSVSVYGSDGVGLIQTSTASSAGNSTPPINLSNYTGGRFYVRVTGLGPSGQSQMYRLSVTAGSASPPFNDSCANAIPIGEGTFTGDNGGANTDGSAGACGTSFGDVWYVYTSPCRGTLDINTCGSTLDTVLSVHRGACGALTQLFCNDNAPVGSPCTGTASAVSFEAVEDETYYIRIAGKTNAPGLYTLNLNLRAPANDLCANAITLAASGNLNSTTCGAGRDIVASCAPVSASPDVWYRYVASCTGGLRLNLCTSDFDTVVSVYSGACGTLTEVACNDDAPTCGGTVGTSDLVAPVTAGQTYFIRVSGFAGAAGRFSLTWEPTQANDSCSTAATITPGSIQGSLCGARRDLTNTCQAASTSPDVFYSYVPASSGQMTINTCGSNFDTLLEVFTGTCTTLTSVACNDNHASTTCNSGPTTSRIAMSVTAGVPYIIRVSGRNNQSGDFTLTLAQSAANDLCASATVITSGQYSGTIAGAGRDGTDTCAPTSPSPDVWYRWVATCNGNLVVNTCGSAYDTLISVHTGACGSLTQIACNDDADGGQCGPASIQSYLSVPVTAGTAYIIRVSGFSGAAGAFTLNVAGVAANDTCAAAAPVAVGVIPFDTRCATNDGAVICGGSNTSPDVWFRFTAPCNGPVWFNTCGSTLDTVLSVGSGACGSLSAVVCNDNQGSAACPSNATSSRVAIRAIAGTAYTIRVAGNFGLVGTGNLSVRCCGADFNLNFVVDVQDIFDMLNAWFASLPSSDVNGSGTISVQDIFDFLNTWFAGCP